MERRSRRILKNAAHTSPFRRSEYKSNDFTTYERETETYDSESETQTTIS